MRSRIIVVGGGVGGMAAAALLARAGYSVDLFEKNTVVGGKMGRVHFDGCTFDTGPSLITMPFVLDDFFRSMGTSLEAEVDLRRVDPSAHYRWSDGTRLDMPFELADVPQAIAALSERDGEAVKRYLDNAHFLYEATKDIFLFRPFGGFREFLKPQNMSLLRALPRLRFTSTLHDVHAHYFTDRRIVQLFDRFATYNGSSPYKAPGTLSIIPWVEFNYGAWYPMGGIYSIAQAMQRVALAHGVRIHTNTAVLRVMRAGRRAVGVELDTGERVTADRVISNVDVRTTRTHLLGQKLPPTKDLSSSGLVMLMSVEKADHGLSHHNVLFSNDYEAEFTDIFHWKRFPAQPTIYISRSCHTDASQSPPDKENWFVLANAPPSRDLDDEQAWANAGIVMDRMHAFGIRPNVAEMRIKSSADMAVEWGAEGGALYGPSSNSMFSAFLRQQQRSSRLQDLWYVGGSAHPGGGVPLVIISGTIAAQQIINEDT